MKRHLRAVCLILWVLAVLGCRACAPGEKDAQTLEQLRGALTRNQSINERYAEFHNSEVMKKPVSSVVGQYDELLKAKKDLLDAVKNIEPSFHHYSLQHSLTESLSTDHQLLALEREWIIKFTVSMKRMEEFSEAGEALKQKQMSDAERTAEALKSLDWFRKEIRETADWMTRHAAAEKVARANCVNALNALNEEVKRENLPNIHRNVFEREPARPTSPADAASPKS